MRPQPECSECEKLSAVAEKSNVIGEFLEWMQEHNFVVASWDDDGELYPCRIQINPFLAQYFEIDMDKVEQERMELLKWLQEAHEERNK